MVIQRHDLKPLLVIVTYYYVISSSSGWIAAVPIEKDSNDYNVPSNLIDRSLQDGGWIRSDAGLFIPVPKPGEIFEGDIEMTRSLRDAVLGTGKRSALDGSQYLWPDGYVPFTIAKGMPTGHLESIAQAIAHMHLGTCIRLKPRKHEEDFVEFNWKKDTCSSAVGRQGHKQMINIGRKCLLFGHVIHEIMHAIGFIHEHSRPDRDKYIQIFYSNIKPRQKINFQKYSFEEVRDLDEQPYNFDSLMQYPNDAFSMNGKPTLISRADPFRKFGQRSRFDSGDIRQINRLYKCDEKRKTDTLW